MKTEIARRFLARNRWNIVKHEIGISSMCSSMWRRVKICQRVIKAEVER